MEKLEIKIPWEIGLQGFNSAIKNQLQSGNEIKITPINASCSLGLILSNTKNLGFGFSFFDKTIRIKPIKITTKYHTYRGSRDLSLDAGTSFVNNETTIKVSNSERRMILTKLGCIIEGAKI